MSKKKATKPTPKPKTSQGVSKPLVYGPVADPTGGSKKSEPKKP